MTLLLRTLQDRPGNEDQLRGIIQAAIQTGYNIRVQEEKQSHMLEQIREINREMMR